jgi:hypothetical protein
VFIYRVTLLVFVDGAGVFIVNDVLLVSNLELASRQHG